MRDVKYSRDVLADAAIRATSLTRVLKNLGVESYSGGMSNYIRDRLKFFGIDTSHFVGRCHARGVPSTKKKKSASILKRIEGGYREKASLLRRALQEVGVPYQCAICSLANWEGKPLTLEIDHIDGDWRNNQRENLRFLCPNCHTQTPNYGNRGRLAFWEGNGSTLRSRWVRFPHLLLDKEGSIPSGPTAYAPWLGTMPEVSVNVFLGIRWGNGSIALAHSAQAGE